MVSNIHHPLIPALLKDAAYDHPTENIELLETHISWVILTGKYAYKIKKPVDLGFLDFSTLEKRQFYCNEELRLNRRLLPQLYLAVVPITGTSQQPHINGTGNVIDYAVKMQQFPQESQLDRLLQNKLITHTHINTLATKISHFHQNCTVADNKVNYGDPELILAPVIENFEQIKHQEGFEFNSDKLQQILDWSNVSYQALYHEFQSRKSNNFIRECHGDMHLRNMAFWKEQLMIFDCLEFDDKLRWIDVISEVAFTVMDLDEREQYCYSWQFLNSYLEQTGDYDGIKVLRFYLVYRAMVKAKVNCIEAQQQIVNKSLKNRLIQNYKKYIDLALNYTQPKRASLIIMHGFSGSGKTYLSQKIVEKAPVIRLRSDIERKRLFGLDTSTNTHSIIGGNIYTNIATENTYQCLFNHARTMLQNGWSVLIDATFLSITYREQAYQIAKENNARFIILDCQAKSQTLHNRIAKRIKVNNDASEADHGVLENQLVHHESLIESELYNTFRINTENESEKILLLNQFLSRFYN